MDAVLRTGIQEVRLHDAVGQGQQHHLVLEAQLAVRPDDVGRLDGGEEVQEVVRHQAARKPVIQRLGSVQVAWPVRNKEGGNKQRFGSEGERHPAPQVSPTLKP